MSLAIEFVKVLKFLSAGIIERSSKCGCINGSFVRDFRDCVSSTLPFE